MTPTSPLAGALTGLVEGLVLAIIVFTVIALMARRQRVAVRHPVADDPAPTTRAFTPSDSTRIRH